MQRVAGLRIPQQRLDPGLVRILDLAVLLEEQLSQQDPDSNVRERPKGKNAVRRSDETLDLRVLSLDARNDVADRLVDERQPDFLGSQDKSGLRAACPPGDLECHENQQSGEQTT